MRVVSNFILILMKQEAHLRLYSVIRFKFICVLLLFIYSFSSIKFVATEKTLFFIFQLYYNRNLAYKINMAFKRHCLLLMQPLNLQDTSQVAILIKGGGGYGYSYIVAVCFIIGGRNWSTRKKQSTYCKSLSNFIT